MNVPVMDKEDAAYGALVKFSWQPIDYRTRPGGSNIRNDKTYDQMVFAPGGMAGRVKARDVFDFDNAVFRPLWDRLNADLSPKKAQKRFNQYVQHHFSDHRPIWIELDTT